MNLDKIKDSNAFKWICMAGAITFWYNVWLTIQNIWDKVTDIITKSSNTWTVLVTKNRIYKDIKKVGETDNPVFNNNILKDKVNEYNQGNTLTVVEELNEVYETEDWTNIIRGYPIYEIINMKDYFWRAFVDEYWYKIYINKEKIDKYSEKLNLLNKELFFNYVLINEYSSVNYFYSVINQDKETRVIDPRWYGLRLEAENYAEYKSLEYLYKDINVNDFFDEDIMIDSNVLDNLILAYMKIYEKFHNSKELWQYSDIKESIDYSIDTLSEDVLPWHPMQEHAIRVRENMSVLIWYKYINVPKNPDRAYEMYRNLWYFLEKYKEHFDSWYVAQKHNLKIDDIEDFLSINKKEDVY